MAHAKFSPSNSKRWLTCTSSMLLPPKPEVQTSFANRGTALHAMADDILKGKPVEDEYEDYAPTDEDIKCTVLPYVDYVKSIPAAIRFYEKKVFISKECFGTADFIGYDIETETLHIADLKAGKGVFVSAVNNTQLMIYAIGALNFIRENGYEVKHVFTHVVQPGIDNICRVEVTLGQLEVLESQVLKAIEDVKNKDTKYHASEDGCRWCDHKTTCPLLKKTAQEVAMEDYKNIDLSDSLKLVPILKLYIKAIEEKALEVMGQGQTLDGFRLTRAKGRRAFSDFEAAKTILLSEGVLEADLYHPSKPLTVPQTEKLLKTKGFDVDLTDLVDTPEGAPKIVPEASQALSLDKTKEAIADFKTA